MRQDVILVDFGEGIGKEVYLFDQDEVTVGEATQAVLGYLGSERTWVNADAKTEAVKRARVTNVGSYNVYTLGPAIGVTVTAVNR